VSYNRGISWLEPPLFGSLLETLLATSVIIIAKLGNRHLSIVFHGTIKRGRKRERVREMGKCDFVFSPSLFLSVTHIIRDHVLFSSLRLAALCQSPC